MRQRERVALLVHYVGGKGEIKNAEINRRLAPIDHSGRQSSAMIDISGEPVGVTVAAHRREGFILIVGGKDIEALHGEREGAESHRAATQFDDATLAHRARWMIKKKTRQRAGRGPKVGPIGQPLVGPELGFIDEFIGGRRQGKMPGHIAMRETQLAQRIGRITDWINDGHTGMVTAREPARAAQPSWPEACLKPSWSFGTTRLRRSASNPAFAHLDVQHCESADEPYDARRMHPRAIRLRRPATLSVQEGVFVPTAPPGADAKMIMDEVDRRWNALRAGNAAYFDGRLCHVLGVHRNGHGGCVLHVIDCAYRFFAVQSVEFDLGVRPLGAKGVVERNGRLLMGRRSQRVAMYRNMWEFAPSGSVDFGRPPHEVIVHELEEETGLQVVREPTAIAVLFDPVLRCWEIVYRLTIEDGAEPRTTDEYPEVAWFEGKHLPAEMSPVARQIAKLLCT